MIHRLLHHVQIMREGSMMMVHSNCSIKCTAQLSEKQGAAVHALPWLDNHTEDEIVMRTWL